MPAAGSGAAPGRCPAATPAAGEAVGLVLHAALDGDVVEGGDVGTVGLADVVGLDHDRRPLAVKAHLYRANRAPNGVSLLRQAVAT
jgi:hypothetical protein